MGEKALEILSNLYRVAISVLRRRPNFRIGASRTALGVSVLVLTLLLTACSTTSSTATIMPSQPVASSTPVPTFTPSPTFTPAVTSTVQQTGNPTALDPCQLISSQEASSLSGASFGAGLEETLSGGARTCTYGAQTTNVFYIEVAQAPDKATADADKTQFLADLQANLQKLTSGGMNITQLPNFADGAVTAQVNNTTIGVDGIAFGFLKGTVFFGFSDLVLGAAAPSSTAMQTEATTVLGRLP